ncbi:MAG TPA: hypothetical protein VIL20_23720 [Sandaracinaceae bacterium]
MTRAKARPSSVPHDPTSLSTARVANLLRKRAEQLRELAEVLEQKACAIECAEVLGDAREVVRIKKWVQRHLRAGAT